MVTVWCVHRISVSSYLKVDFKSNCSLNKRDGEFSWISEIQINRFPKMFFNGTKFRT